MPVLLDDLDILRKHGFEPLAPGTYDTHFGARRVELCVNDEGIEVTLYLNDYGSDQVLNTKTAKDWHEVDDLVTEWAPWAAFYASTNNAIADQEEDESAPREPRTWLVAYYHVDRCYGGPEEGGWYYDAGQLIRVARAFKDKDAAYSFCSRLNKALNDWQDHCGIRPLHSVLSTGRIEALCRGDKAPEHFPDRTPHYE